MMMIGAARARLLMRDAHSHGIAGPMLTSALPIALDIENARIMRNTSEGARFERVG